MTYQRLVISLFAAWALSTISASAATLPSDTEFFERKIRPLLVERCYSCHSAASEKLKGDLLLDSKAGVLKGGESKKPAIVPGDPVHSLLIEAVTYQNEDLRMPPKKRLTDEQVADLVAWVKMGAPDPRTQVAKAAPPVAVDTSAAKKHWAFQPIKDPSIPQPKNAGSTPVDHFINARLEEKGLQPLGPADKRTLIRRATYDLTGLPPAPKDIEAFLADASPNALMKVVDRLLSSPQYGECWGRHWLDLVRYADTAGESADYPIPQAYKYRNYVIDSFNADKPYDQFITEQIAGDLMQSRDESDWKRKVIATGFLAIAKRFGVDPEHHMHLTIDDTIDTLGKSMLGLSLNCCRCHDHKFDPLTSKEYYSLYGFFSSTRYPFPGSEERKYQKDFVTLTLAEEAEPAVRAYEQKFNALESEISWQKKMADDGKDTPAGKKAREVEKELRKQLIELGAQGAGFETAYAVAEGTPVEAHVLKRGEPNNVGDIAPRAFPAILGGQTLSAECKSSGRLELASWIASAKNPLTARVIVNRIWQNHFGKGIVATPSDFGTRGSPPTHPELLDYLASHLVENRWSIKSMHRMLMLTDAYQRAGNGAPELVEKDPANDYLARFSTRRLEAEEIRDSILAVSGDLDPSRGEAHPFPPPAGWNFTQHASFSAVYDTTRRSIYLMQQRIKKHPFLAVFDGADPNVTTAERSASTTPIQALFMMNDKFVHTESIHFASKLLAEKSGADPIRRAYLLCYGRPAAEEEVFLARDSIERYAQKLGDMQVPETERPKQALAAYLRVLFASNEFFFVD
jgi:hypothetical protein